MEIATPPSKHMVALISADEPYMMPDRYRYMYIMLAVELYMMPDRYMYIMLAFELKTFPSLFDGSNQCAVHGIQNKVTLCIN